MCRLSLPFLISPPDLSTFPHLMQAREENLLMPSGVSAEGEEYEGATVIEPEKG